MRKHNGSIILVVLLVLCLAGVCLLGAEAWRILHERKGGSDWHEEEVGYLIDLSATADPNDTEAPIDPEATPEAEMFAELAPIVITGLEDFVVKTNPPIPVPTDMPSTAEPQKTAGPEGTNAPGSTAQPEKTAAPGHTEAPEKTAAPVKTDEPEGTTAPGRTESPEKTAQPQETVEPFSTSKPDEVGEQKTTAPTTEPTQPTAQAGKETPKATEAVIPAPAKKTDEPFVQTEAPSGPPQAMPTDTLTLMPTLAPTPTATATPAPTPTPTPTPSPTPTPTPTPSPSPTPVMGRPVTSDVRYSMDYGQLNHINKDFRGWLIGEGTSLNYPVVQGEDNAYYLTHLFNGKENKTGTVFMDCGNSQYITDMCTWLYGHNRKDDTMFAVLPEFMDQKFFDEHGVLYFLTPFGDYQVELFACIRSSVEIEEVWRQKNFENKEEFDAYVEQIRSMSGVQSDTEVLWGDQLLAMCTCTNIVHEDRFVLFGVMRPIVYNTDKAMSVTQLELEKRETYTKTVNVPGYGEAVYYAQNDPTWYNLVYESKKSDKYRKLGQSGCGPTSLAMAIRNITDDEQIQRLLACPISDVGYSFCTCSVNEYYCNRKHIQIEIRTLEMEQKYLPVLLANFATGNNLWKITSRSANNGGTDAVFYEYVAHACSLDYSYTVDFGEMVQAVQNGAIAVTTTGGAYSPFTGGGHYLTLIHVDNEYLYFLDPFYKEDYSKSDRNHVIEVLEPGLIRVKIKDTNQLYLFGFHLFQQRPGYVPPESRTAQ